MELPCSEMSQSQMDNEISRLEERLLILKRERNSRSIIYHLPNEILERILRLVQVQDGTENLRFTDSTWTGLNKKWGRTMLICKRVRDAALQITSLWSVVDTTMNNKDGLEICLQRAGTHELELYGSIQYEDDVTTRRTFELMSMASHMRLVIPYLEPEEPRTQAQVGDCIDYFIRRHLNVEHPNLRSLELFNESNHEDHYWCFLGLGFLGEGPCHLTNLLLEGCKLVNPPAIPSLMELTLITTQFHTDCRGMRKFLGDCPSIRILRIHDPVAERPGFDPIVTDSETQPPYPPHLHTLQLVGKMGSIGRFVHVLPVPNQHLDIRVQDGLRDDTTEILVQDPRDAISQLSYRIYCKALEFLQQDLPGKTPARHTVEAYCCDHSELVTRLTVSSDPLDYKTFGLTMRLVFSTEASKVEELTKMVQYADTFVVPHHPGQVQFNEALITRNPHIRDLVISNSSHLSREMARTLVVEYVETLERIFSSRYQIGMPVRNMSFRFKGAKSDRHELLVQNIIAQGLTWKDAGWVQEIVFSFGHGV